MRRVWSAVTALTLAATGILHAPPISAAEVRAITKEVSLELVSTAENSTTDWTRAYGYLQDIGDGRGYTGGLVGFCSGTGDMLVLLERYTAAQPGNGLARFLPAMRQVMAAPYGQRPGLSHSLLGSAFVTAWQKEASVSAFRAAQRAERDRVYWNPAAAQAAADKVSPLGYYLYYDILVNHGPGSDPQSFGGIRQGVISSGVLPPSLGGGQTAWLKALVTARDKVLKQWGDYQSNGRSGIALKLITDNKYNLTPPLNWSVYGDRYTITGLPDRDD